MIKFDYAGKEYELEFIYLYADVSVEIEGKTVSVGRTRESTTIRLREVGGYSAVSTVTRYHKDPPNLEQARRAALAKVLGAWHSHLIRTPEILGFRMAVWDAYFTSKECKKSARPAKYKREETQYGSNQQRAL